MRHLLLGGRRLSSQADDYRYQSLIERQSSQLTQLKSQLATLRSQYNDFKRDYQLQSPQLQRQLYSVQRRRELLQKRLADLKASQANRQHEQMASEMIDQIAFILSSYRPTICPPPSKQIDPVPIQIETPSVRSDFTIEPIILEDSIPEVDSIAARRTRRASAIDVYYKEPSLRSQLTPGDPYTFSLEDGLVTPRVPTGYTRQTPAVERRRSSAKRK
jgi:hypothetical protein